MTADCSHPPFAFRFTPSVPELLDHLKCSLAFTTYQAGKVVFLSAVGGGRLIQLPRTFQRPMGMAVSGNRLAVATKWTVEVLENCPSLAPNYPAQPNTYDALYVPRVTYYSGLNNLHDIDWGQEGLWAVNTEFSCLCTIDDRFSFRQRWHPPFIKAITPNDHCHLNGMALENGIPRYVSALGSGDAPKSWRNDRLHTGVIVDVPSNEVMVGGLAIPHSPRLIDGKLYVLLSATGELIQIDRHSSACTTITRLNGYVRGLDYYQGYFFVGHSKVREENAKKCHYPILEIGDRIVGLAIVDARTGTECGRVEYATSVEDIYDVRVLPGIHRPGICNPSSEQHQRALVTEETSYWIDIEEK